MRLIEFKNEIKLFNDRNNVFKIILDEDFKEEPYHDFRRYTGVFATPYIVEGNFVMAYYINDISLTNYFEMAIKNGCKSNKKIDKNTYRRLFKEKVLYGNHLVCPENILYEVKYLFEKRIISNTEYYNKFIGRGVQYTGVTNLLNKVPLEDFDIKDKSILIHDCGAKDFSRGDLINFKDIFTLEEQPYFFNVYKNRMIVDVDGLNNLYKGYLTKLENLYDMKHINSNNTDEVNREIKNLLYDITKMHNCVKHYKLNNNLYEILESLSNLEKFKENRLEYNKIALMILGDSNATSSLLVPFEVLNYVRTDLNLQANITKVKTMEVDLPNLKELRGFVSYINKSSKKVKLLLDTKCNKNIYNKSKKLTGVIPYPIYLREDKKLVICYECFTLESFKKLEDFSKETSHILLTKTLVRRLSIASYKYIDSCIFKPTVYRTYKYLHKASILGSEDLLLEGRTCLVRNMRDLLSVVPLSDIVDKDEDKLLYFKLPGLYKARNLYHKIRYDKSKGTYYTLVKINLYSWEYIDTILNALEYFGDYKESKEFSTMATSLMEEVIGKIKNKQKLRNELDTVEQFYIECARQKHVNLLTGTVDRILKNKISDLVDAKLKSDLDLNYIKQELNLA